MANQRGAVRIHQFRSKLLRGNPLKDPYLRDIAVYLPPGYSPSDSKGYVAAFGLVGFGGTGRMLFNLDPLGESLDMRLDRLISTKKCGPMILVLADCFTRFGGNQYINSSATGRYEDYIVQEIVPFIDANYNVHSRAVWGKSSGGYGAMILGMKHPDVFKALADHSGDSAFEYCYLPDFPKAMDALREAGSAEKWLDKFWKKPNRHAGGDMQALNILAMAAHYSPSEKRRGLGVDLPFDINTGELRESVWKRWLANDPVQLVKKYSRNLKRLKLLYLDCGSRDEFNLHWGARLLAARLKESEVKHYYQEFDDGHMNISYRYDHSLPMIYNALNS
ncbi:MAG: alpha/beta hydrolase [Nitrososphaerales archaeon]